MLDVGSETLIRPPRKLPKVIVLALILILAPLPAAVAVPKYKWLGLVSMIIGWLLIVAWFVYINKKKPSRTRNPSTLSRVSFVTGSVAGHNIECSDRSKRNVL